MRSCVTAWMSNSRNWLQGTPEEAFRLIKTSDPHRMEIVQSGLDKRDPLHLSTAFQRKGFRHAEVYQAKG
jgi:hypothetical protein